MHHRATNYYRQFVLQSSLSPYYKYRCDSVDMPYRVADTRTYQRLYNPLVLRCDRGSVTKASGVLAGGDEMKYIYVAGPYTNDDPVLNVRKAIEAGEQLIALGFVPFIPHLTHLWHLISPHDIEYWYEYDNEWIRKCDALLRLPGESKGADDEVYLMFEMGKSVYYSIDALTKAAEAE